MSDDFGEITQPKGIKPHRCEYCYVAIPAGEKHVQFKGMWDGDWQNWRMHYECYEDYSAREGYPDEGFTPGEAEMPDRLKSSPVAR